MDLSGSSSKSMLRARMVSVNSRGVGRQARLRLGRVLAKRWGRAYTGANYEVRRRVVKLISRREAGKNIVAAGAGLLAASRGALGLAKIDSVVRGVALGSQSYSFRDRDLDACLEGFRAVGLGECELWDAHTAPRRLSGDELTRWRLETPLRHFEQVRKKFDNAGVHLHALTCNLRRESSDQEIQRVFEMASALGVSIVTSSAPVSIAPRVDPYARKYRIKVGFHGHDATDKPDEFSTAETFERAMRGASEYICVNLDIGHFTAANGDPVEYIRQHHDRIVTLHIKDRKKNHGANLPFGQGDTPIGPVLRLLRDQQWKIYANIEYEYGEETKGLDTLEEMKKCYAYCRRELEA
jgi:sugar phosphate isomerase/epimerase